MESGDDGEGGELNLVKRHASRHVLLRRGVAECETLVGGSSGTEWSEQTRRDNKGQKEEMSKEGL